jgi:hypothetical protein
VPSMSNRTAVRGGFAFIGRCAGRDRIGGKRRAPCYGEAAGVSNGYACPTAVKACRHATISR